MVAVRSIKHEHPVEPAVGRLPLEETEDSLAKREQRRANGQCVTCGQQLYDFQPRNIFSHYLRRSLKRKQGSPYRKVPMSVPTLVLRGKCLRCNPPLQSSEVTSSESICEEETSEGPTLTPEQIAPSLDGEAPIRSNVSDLTENVEPVEDLPYSPTDTLEVAPVVTVEYSEREEVIADVIIGEVATAIDVATSTPSGSMSVYEGPFNHRGEKHGEGTLSWGNGDVYKGTFVDGNREGFGTLLFGRGGEYVGEWKMNHMHGSGTRRYPNGDVYTGSYVYGRREGEGQCYYRNGNHYWGEWQKNGISGYGRYYYASGQRFEGYFVNGKRNRKGELKKTDGTVEVFQYVDDERVGFGIRWSSTRTEAWKLEVIYPTSEASPTAQPRMRKERVSVDEALARVTAMEWAPRTDLPTCLGQ